MKATMEFIRFTTHWCYLRLQSANVAIS